MLGEIKFHVSAALAALAVIGELDIVGIGYEIRRHEKSARHFSLATEVTLGIRIEPIEKRVIIFENEIDVMEEVDHEAGVRHSKIAGRLAAARVKVLIPGIEWNREKTSRPPLKGMFLAVFLPDGRRAVTLAHVNHLLVEVFLRF